MRAYNFLNERLDKILYLRLNWACTLGTVRAWGAVITTWFGDSIEGRCVGWRRNWRFRGGITLFRRRRGSYVAFVVLLSKKDLNRFEIRFLKWVSEAWLGNRIYCFYIS